MSYGSSPWKRILRQFRQPECLIEFAVSKQPGVGSDLCPQEPELQAVIKSKPQILILEVTHWFSPRPHGTNA
jgi:hypothetical protein